MIVPEDCIHGLIPRSCWLCSKRGTRATRRSVRSKFEGQCRLCRERIGVGERIAKRPLPWDLDTFVWAHETCPSYVKTVQERHEDTGRRDPVATQPQDRSSRWYITQLATEGDEDSEIED